MIKAHIPVIGPVRIRGHVQLLDALREGGIISGTSRMQSRYILAKLENLMREMESDAIASYPRALSGQ